MCLPELKVESVGVVVTSTVASSDVESAVIVATSSVASSVYLKKFSILTYLLHNLDLENN